MKRHILVFLFLMMLMETHATTWFPSQVKCPVCQEKNEFFVIGSYGGYIYRWPSKYQYIFWPLIDSNVLYSCKGCHLTCFMWDFRKFPKDKVEEVKKLLKSLAIKWEKQKKYHHIPMSKRFEVAEKIYLTLKKNTDFWCTFYRAKGYHEEREGNKEQARNSRKQALEIALKMFAEDKNKGIQKELLLITGSMRYHLKDRQGALQDFKKALKLKYENKKHSVAAQQNIDRYLSDLLKDYMEKIHKEIKAKRKK